MRSNKIFSVYFALLLVACCSWEVVKGFNATGNNTLREETGTCEHFDCQNEGTCHVGNEGPYCNCLDGYEGDLCEIALGDTCEHFNCQNAGTCHMGNEGPYCNCLDGFVGDFCEVECNCGSHGNCTFVDGKKSCSCDFGFAVIDGSCEVCNCGWNGYCLFNKGVKVCDCQFGYYEKHGVCQALPVPSFEISTMGSTIIVFQAVNEAENSEVYYYEVEFQQVAYPFSQYERWNVTRKGDRYTLSNLNRSAIYSIRFRSFSNLGTSQWTPSRRYELTNENNVPEEPFIIRPSNGDVFSVGRIQVAWRAPRDNGSPISEYVISFYRRDYYRGNSSSWNHVLIYFSNHSSSKDFYLLETNTLLFSGEYKVGVTARHEFVSGKTAEVYFFVDNFSQSHQTLFLPLIVAVNSLFLIVSVSFCIYCCVKRRNQARHS